MESLPHLTAFLNDYGYYAIFLLVFLQQIGVPNPATNELVLIFCGYLSYTGTFGLVQSAAASAAADIVGTTGVYLLFYSFSKWIIEHSPKWIPLKGKTIERMEASLNRGGMAKIYIARHTPFVRGYISVVAGMAHLDRKKFLPSVVITAITWNGGLVLLGFLMGPYWKAAMKDAGIAEAIIFGCVLVAAIVMTGRYFMRRQMQQQ